MLEEELSFANEVADEAARIALSSFGSDPRVRLKPDRTPVTEADEAIEAMVRERVAARFPGDAILGEEGGGAGDGSRRWIVDPIDGTKNFADGVQLWATLLALEVDGALVLGLVSAPALGERYEAVRDQGARLNGEPIHVSRADRISRAFVCYADVHEWLDDPAGPALLEIVRSSRRNRGFGDFWGHCLVARGAADVMFEPSLSTWDYAACRVIVEEAGGTMTRFDGGPVEHGGSVLTSNGILHDELVARLRPTARG
ncbi:MAG: inositol monophosphatase [Candidatus Velamenicoccus archaeovorus]